MRRSLLAPAALVGVLLLASPGWAPPPVFRPPPPPPPRPVPVPVRPPTTTPYRPPGPIYRPPLILPLPDFSRQVEEARRRNASEAADLLRRQSAASLSRAQRAALLNEIAHDLLRQQQAASLADLRRLRADWVAVGPGVGLDPIVAMQLEAAESAAERLLLAEILLLIRDAQFASADAKLGAIDSPRYLPAAVVHALPDLRAALRLITPYTRMQAELRQNASYRVTANLMSDVPPGQRPDAVSQAFLVWGSLARVEDLLGNQRADKLDAIELAIAGVEKVHGVPLARKLRAEVSAQLYLFGRADDAALLLEGGVDPVHAAAVLADLRAIVLGRGEITTPQVALFVPASQTTPPAQSVAALSPDQLIWWKPPARKPGVTTVDAAIADTRAELKVAVNAAVDANTTKVSAAADRIRAALAAEAAPLKAFVEKVEAARGKPLAAPAERQLAAIAGTRGMTVAEAVGVLAVEADRPTSAARLLATVPAFGGPGEFVAAVELSGRAPAAFAAFPDAGFKLGAVRDRARIREAFAAVLNAHAAKVAAGQEVPGLERAAVEADVHKRLGLAGGAALTPAERVQALLDVCRDWADDHARLADVMRDLNQAVADIETGDYGPNDDELKELTVAVKGRRLLVQADKKRREAGVVIGCQLLGGYGPDAAPAREWLGAQLDGGEKPWRSAVTAAREKIGAK